MWDGGPQTLHRAQGRGLKMWTSQDGGKGPKPTHANSRPSTRLQPCRRCIRASEGIVSNKFPIAPVGQRQSSQRIDCETHTAHDRFLTQFSNSCRSMRCRLHHWPTARQSTAQNHRWGSLTTRTIGQKGGGGVSAHGGKTTYTTLSAHSPRATRPSWPASNGQRF